MTSMYLKRSADESRETLNFQTNYIPIEGGKV